jgi:hypothetical protein
MTARVAGLPVGALVRRDAIHPAMREALGAFEVLRRFGFESDDIFFHQNAEEVPGREPKGMMFVVLKTQGKDFSIRVGVVDLPYEVWIEEWTAVATAAAEKRIVGVDRIVDESLARSEMVGLLLAIHGKGIRVPVAQLGLS